MDKLCEAHSSPTTPSSCLAFFAATHCYAHTPLCSLSLLCSHPPHWPQEAYAVDELCVEGGGQRTRLTCTALGYGNLTARCNDPTLDPLGSHHNWDCVRGASWGGCACYGGRGCPGLAWGSWGAVVVTACVLQGRV